MTKKAVLITGASSGFGEAIAQHFSEQGDCVIGTSRKTEWPENLADIGLNRLPLDVCEDTSVAALGDWCDTHNFIPDVLILNAGYGFSGPIEETTIEQAKAQFDTNFFGVHRVVRQFLPKMRARKSGHIIIISSIGGFISVPFQAFYCASKFAVESYGEALRRELMVFGINVSMVEPGDYKTNFGQANEANPIQANSPYEPQSSRAIGIMRKSEDSGSDPKDIARLVGRIADTNAPRLRYVSDSLIERIIVYANNLLPNKVIEHLVMAAYKVPRK
jgi:short-subunit dehydrogenase